MTIVSHCSGNVLPRLANGGVSDGAAVNSEPSAKCGVRFFGRTDFSNVNRSQPRAVDSLSAHDLLGMGARSIALAHGNALRVRVRSMPVSGSVVSAPLCDLVAHVFGMRSGEQVIGIHARGDIAPMADVKTVSDSSVGKKERNPVRSPLLTGERNDAVTSRRSAERPDHAPRRLVELGVREEIGERLYVALKCQVRDVDARRVPAEVKNLVISRIAVRKHPGSARGRDNSLSNSKLPISVRCFVGRPLCASGGRGCADLRTEPIFNATLRHAGTSHSGFDHVPGRFNVAGTPIVARAQGIESAAW